MPIFYIFAFKHHTCAAGQDQFLMGSNNQNHLALFVCVKQRYKRMKRFPVSHLYSGLEASLDNCARTLNVDPLKQLSVIAGGGWRGAVEDQWSILQSWQESLKQSVADGSELINAAFPSLWEINCCCCFYELNNHN